MRQWMPVLQRPHAFSLSDVCGGYNQHWLSGRLIAVLIDEQIELRIEMAKVIGCMCGLGNGCCHEIGDRRKEMNAETARLLR